MNEKGNLEDLEDVLDELWIPEGEEFANQVYTIIRELRDYRNAEGAKYNDRT